MTQSILLFHEAIICWLNPIETYKYVSDFGFRCNIDSKMDP